MCPSKLNGRGLEQVKFQARAKHIKNVDLLALYQGGDADGPVVERIVLGRGIPGLDNLAVAEINGSRFVIVQPFGLDRRSDCRPCA